MHFDLASGLQQQQAHAPSEATPADQTHELVACMVDLVTASASFTCCTHATEGGEPGGGPAQGARRSLAFGPEYPAGMLHLRASPDTDNVCLGYGGFDTAVPWWLQQEKQAAADSSAATLASLVTYASSLDQASITSLVHSTSQSSQASGSQTVLPVEPAALRGVLPLPSSLSWTLRNATPAAIASILPLLCSSIIFLAAPMQHKGAQSDHGAQSVAFQPGLAASLLRWEGFREIWVDSLPQYLATDSGIQALVACVSDRESCRLTDAQHITYILLLKHALHCAGRVPALPHAVVMCVSLLLWCACRIAAVWLFACAAGAAPGDAMQPPVLSACLLEVCLTVCRRRHAVTCSARQPASGCSANCVGNRMGACSVCHYTGAVRAASIYTGSTGG